MSDGSEWVLYECGETRFDSGRQEAPNTCPTCDAPIDAVRSVRAATEQSEKDG